MDTFKTDTAVNYYYIELDNLDENIKKHYKEYFELKDYTGYLPYILLSEKDKLLSTHHDIYKLEDLKKILK